MVCAPWVASKQAADNRQYFQFCSNLKISCQDRFKCKEWYSKLKIKVLFEVETKSESENVWVLNNKFDTAEIENGNENKRERERERERNKERERERESQQSVIPFFFKSRWENILAPNPSNSSSNGCFRWFQFYFNVTNFFSHPRFHMTVNRLDNIFRGLTKYGQFMIWREMVLI